MGPFNDPCYRCWATGQNKANLFLPNFSNFQYLFQVQYLDLDLPDSDEKISEKKKKPEEESSHTVYKTVDFIKTEAFNRTRQKVEEYKYNIKPDGK